jgi:hypothetical protein
VSNEGMMTDSMIEIEGKNLKVFVKARKDIVMMIKSKETGVKDWGIGNSLNRKHEHVTC